jgi:hypothetical protein
VPQNFASASEATVTQSASIPPLPAEAPPSSIISVTTNDGDVIHYKDSKIDSVERKTGEGVVLIRSRAGMDLVDADNNLYNAEITYPDGSVQIVGNGKVCSIFRPGEGDYYYNDDGTIKSIEYLDHSISEYLYAKDGNGKIVRTIIVTPENTAYYGADNRLERVEFKTGRIVEYHNGIIASVTGEGSNRYYFKEAVTAQGQTEARLIRYVYYGNNFVEFNDDGSVKSSTFSQFQTGLMTTYAYDGLSVIQTDADSFDYNSSFWCDMPNRRHTIANGMLVLNGSFNRSNGLFDQVSVPRWTKPVYTMDFSVNNRDPYLYIGLAGGGNAGWVKSAIVTNSGNIDIQATINNKPVKVATAIEGFKVNTTYTLEFDVSWNGVNIYIWEKGAAKPAAPIHVFDASSVPYYFNVESYLKNGATSFDNFSLTQSLEPQIVEAFEENIIDAFKDKIILSKVIYDASGMVKEVVDLAGKTISFNDVGVQVLLGQSIRSTIDINNADAVVVDRDGIKRIYDDYGFLSGIESASVTVSFADGCVAKVEKEDGTIIEAYKDSSGMTKITRPDGVEAYYTGEKLTRIIQPDKSEFLFDQEGNIIEYINKDGVPFDYTPTADGGRSGHADPAALSDSDIEYQIYDPAKKLVKIIRKNGKWINYTYTIADIIANDNNETETIYDKEWNIRQTIIFPTQNEPSTIISIFQYGRIREVYKEKNNVRELIYTYAYEFDGTGKETTVIKDMKTGEIKRYKDELLISVTDKNSLVTSYEYDDQKRIKKSTAAYLGRVINSYAYTYDGDLTTIEGVDGVKRTYGVDDKIMYLEESGRTYQYAYTTDEAGTEISTQELIKIKDASGATANYSNGVLLSIVKPDGATLGDFVFSPDGTVAEYSILRDGVKYFIQDGKVVKEIRFNGMIIEYNAEGLVAKVFESADKVTQYSYEYSGQGQIGCIMVVRDGLKYRYDKNGSFIEMIGSDDNHYYYDALNRLIRVIDKNQQTYDLSYANNSISIHSFYEIKQSIANELSNLSLNSLVVDTSNNNLAIKLARNYNFDFGDGSDGDLRVEAGQTIVINGIKNYKSIYVAPGATLTVSPWDGLTGGEILIKCQGSVIIEGSIEANAKGFKGGCGSTDSWPCALGMQGGSYTGGQSYSNGNNYGGGGGIIRYGYPVYGNYHGPAPYDYAGGAGGSYGTSGQNGYGTIYRNTQYSYAGSVYGDQFLSSFYKGSGGGAGCYQSPGGNGGGAIKIIASQININGSISSRGGNGASGSGGGSGGAVWIIGDNININGVITAIGGCGSSYSSIYYGGNGGDGRIRIDYGTFTGNMPTPTPYMVQIPYNTQGQFISTPIATTATKFEGILANVSTSVGTGIRFMTRTGASDDVADGSWSEWVEAPKDLAGYKINSSINKYIQYQAVFETTNITQTPAILQSGDYAIKLNYSYDRVFDATAPPDDASFKDHLIFIPPEFPIPLDLASLKPDFTSIIEDPVKIESRILPDETIIYTKSFKEGTDDISVDTTKDSKITYYAAGKVRATYQKHEDNHLELLIEYSYDNDGNLMSVNMPSARDSLDTQVTVARQRIAEESASYLRTLAQQKGLAYTQIRDQIQVIRDQISTQRSVLQPQLYQQVTRSRWVGWWIFGWYETYTETIEVPGVRGAINTLNEQERQLNIQEANAYAQLDAQVSAAQQALGQDESSALIEVANQEKQLQNQIVGEESMPVILEYYRSILGRDPDDLEAQGWLNTVNYNSKIDVNILNNTLLNSQERIYQAAFVAGLKEKIKNKLYEYLSLDEADRGSLLGTLGLSVDGAVRLSTEDIDAILALLDKQNIHFGRSAFVALGAILTNSGITYNLEDLAFKAILIDIFTGSLNALNENKLLELSMYSLSKVASTYGINLVNTRLNFDDLMAVSSLRAPEGGEAIPLNIIAHLKNNHYVVVTNIAADGKVSYREHNRGKDGYTWTVSRQDFENSWTGYTIVQGKIGTVPEGDCPILPESIFAKMISDDTAMRIKGSCLPFLFPLLGMIFGAITGIATAVVGAIGAIVAGISAVIGPIIAGIGQLITGIAGFMTQIGGALFSAVQFVGTSLLPTIGGWIGGIGSWIGGVGSFLGNALGLGNVITATGFNLTALGASIGNTIVTTALSIGITKGLERLGVDTTISSLVSAFVTGGVGGFISGHSVLSAITGGLQGLAIQGVSQLAPRLGIDPMLSNVISIAAGSFIGAVGSCISPMSGRFDLDGFSRSIGTKIIPSISSEFAYYGITKAGELLGVDPRISYLAGVGIRSSISTGYGTDGVFDWQDAWGGIQQGLLQGVTNIGLNFATDELGLNPLLANLGFSAIASVINAGIQATIGTPNPQTGERLDVFKTIYDTYMNNALTVLGYTEPGMPVSPWQQAAYISQILDFSNIVQERGLVNALNTYGAGFLNAVAVNQIVKSGYTIGGYFADRLNSGQSTLRTLQDGKQVRQVAVKDAQGNIVANVFFEQKPDGTLIVVGKEEFIGNSTYLSWGETAVDAYGKLGYTDAQLYSMFDSDIQYQRVVDGQQAYVEIKDLQGNTLLVIEPTVTGSYNVYNSYGDYVEAKVSSILSGKTYSFSNDVLRQYQELNNTNTTSLFDVDFSNLATIGLMFNNLSLSSSDIAKYNFTDAQKKQITYVIFNGIRNPCPEGLAPAYMRGLETQLAIADPSGATIRSVAMFPWAGWTSGNSIVNDSVAWIANAYLGSHELTNDVINGMQLQFGSQIPSNMTGVAYSGSGDPLIQALNAKPAWDMNTVVLVDTPIAFERKITNPNVDNVIMIGANNDPISVSGFISQGFDTNPRPLNVYKMILNGVSHTQFSYDPDNTSPDPVAVRSARFIAEVSAIGGNTTDLKDFFDRQILNGAINYDATTKVYFVDLGGIQYNDN